MFCPKCGSTIKKEAICCSNCGRKLTKRELDILWEEQHDIDISSEHSPDFSFYLQRIGELERYNQELRHENNALHQQLANTQNLDVASSTINDLESELDQLRQEIKSYKKKVKILKETNETLTIERDEKTKYLAGLENIILNIRAQVSGIAISGNMGNDVSDLSVQGNSYKEKPTKIISNVVAKTSSFIGYLQGSRICPYCKEKVRDGADYCTACGFKMPIQSEQEQLETELSLQENTLSNEIEYIDG